MWVHWEVYLFINHNSSHHSKQSCTRAVPAIQIIYVDIEETHGYMQYYQWAHAPAFERGNVCSFVQNV